MFGSDEPITPDYVFSLDLSEDIVAYYTANFDGSFTDETGRFNGTINGNPTYVTGKLEKGIDFDGTGDYVNCGRLTQTESASKVSVSFWMNQDTLNVFDTLVGKDVGSATDNFSIFTYTDGNMYFEPMASATRGYLDYSLYVTAGTWAHIVMVFDGTAVGNSGRLKVYIDGTERTLTYAGTIGTTTLATTYDLYLGANVGASQPYAGLMDEIIISNRAFNQADVNTLNNSGAGIRAKNFFEGSPELTDNLVAYYPLDGTSCVDEAGGSDGTVSGNPTIVSGVVNNAIDFDGTGDYIDAGTISEIEGVGAFSISCWMYHDSNSGNQGLWSKSQGGGAGAFTFRYNDSGNEWAFEVDGAYGAGDAVKYDDPAIPTGQWNHLVFVFDGSLTNNDRLKLYVNSTLATVSDQGGSIPTTTATPSSNLIIGTGSGGSSGDYFNGKIQDFAVFTKALASEEVTTLNNSDVPLRLTAPFQGSSTLTTGLEASYTFRNAATDDYGDNDGTVSGATYNTDGKVGNCYTYDGINDNIDISAGSTTDIYDIDGGDVTVSQWFKRDSTTNTQEFTFMNRNLGADFWFGWDGAIDSTNEFSVYIVVSGTNIKLYGGAGIALDTDWHHVVVIISPTGTSSLYIDGVLRDSDATSYTPNLAGDAGVSIGANANNDTYEWGGEIGQTLIWNRSLTYDEVIELYNNNYGDFFSENTELSEGLLSYYPLDGTSAVDELGNYDGTIAGTPTVVSGVVNNAMDFTGAGTDKVLTGITPVGDYSVSGWVKWDSIGSTSTSNCFATWGGVNGGWYMGSDGANIKINCYYDTAWKFAYADTSISTGNWYHIVLTFDSVNKVVKYYRDGSYITQSSAITTFTDPVDEICLGNQPGSSTRSIDGQMQDVAIYGKVLTTDEVTLLRNAGSPLRRAIPFDGDTDLVTDLESAYTFDNLAGDDYGDNNGTVNGATLVPDALPIGNAYNFDAINDFISLGNTLPVQTNMSFSYWIDYSSPGFTIVKGDNGVHYEYGFYYGSETLFYVWGVSNTFQSWTISDITGGYHHFVIIKTGTNWELFIDNVSQGSKTLTAATGTGYDTRIGCTSDDNNLIGADIAQPLIWNKALSETEVETLFNNGSGLRLYKEVTDGRGLYFY